jgi:hypothetical protein
MLVALRQLADVAIDELLEEQAVDRRNPLQVIRRHAEIERDPLVPKTAQVEIAL